MIGGGKQKEETMSFVFAEKYNASWSETERLDIHCDTRIVKESISGRTFQPSKDPLLSNTESLKAQSLHPRYVYRLLEMIFYMPPNCSASYMTDTHFRDKT